MNPFPNHRIKNGWAALKQVLTRQSSGSIAVEYALCIVLATILMTGVDRLFTTAVIRVVRRAISIVGAFPNI